jgi:hypothetical protein
MITKEKHDMKRIYLMSLGLMATLAAGSVQGADKGRFGRIGVSYNLNFNVSADFSNIGAFPALSNPGAPLVAPGDMRTYDDGFVGMDNTGNAGDLTSFWGYNNPGQVVGGNLVLNSASSAGGADSLNQDSKLHHGLELTYNYQIRGADWGGWGFEGAFGWLPLNITDNQAVASNVTLVTDTYPGNGIVFPVPPFAGTVAGPGPLLGATPISSVTSIVPGGMITTGQRNIDASVFAFKLGPYLDYNLTERVTLTLSGGLTLALVDSEFTYNELNTIPGVGAQAFTGQDRSSDLLVGGYLGARVAWWLTDNVSVFTGVTYQNVGSFNQQANGRNARLNLGNTVALNVGLGFSF